MQSDCLSFTVFLLVDPGVPYLIEAKDCFLAETRDRLKKRGSKGESYDDIPHPAGGISFMKHFYVDMIF